MNAVTQTEARAIEAPALEAADPTKNLILVPLSWLVLRPTGRNVRKIVPQMSVSELATSIQRVGLLQNLIVIASADGEQYELAAGGRRLAALKLPAKKHRISKEWEVPCLLVADGAARTASLTENVQREAMHPADQFEAFAALVAEDRSIEDIAADFSVTPLVVQRRLKLANVSPRQLCAELAQAVGLNMAAWWQPTAEGYFRHVPKAAILQAVGEYAPESVNRLAKLKKADIASEAERLADGTGWMSAIFKAEGPQEVTPEDGAEDAATVADEPAGALCRREPNHPHHQHHWPPAHGGGLCTRHGARPPLARRWRGARLPPAFGMDGSCRPRGHSPHHGPRPGAATAAPLPSPAALVGQPASAPLTRVALAYIEPRFKFYLRFGEPARTLRLDRWRSIAVFMANAVFCRIRWQAND